MKYLLVSLLAAVSIFSLNGQAIELERELVANYLFTGNAEDISEYLNHGIVNGPTLTQDRFGNDASAYYFDGINDYISVPDADILSFPEQKMSIALWLKNDNPRHSYMLYKGSNTSNREYAMGIRVDRIAAGQINNLGTAAVQYGVLSNTSLNLNEWHHLTMTWNGQYISIYVNGIFESRKEYNVSVGNYNSNLYFGSYGGDITLYAFPGAIDDIFIYKRVINDCEIETLFSGDIFEER